MNAHNNALDAMASAANSFECDYLHLHIPLNSRIFSKDKAELVFLNNQISSLESHISQLNTLLRAFHLRLRQLHNLDVPIQVLPTEVLSSIFQQLIGSRNYNDPDYDNTRFQLRGAFILASVSAHFRNVALGTPQLWKKIAVHISRENSISKFSSLLQHCTALTANVSISVIDKLDETKARSAIDTLLTPDITQKIKVFQLYRSCTPNLWVEHLTGPSFPMLETLCIGYAENSNIGTLKSLTRLKISGRCRGRVILPSSVRFLHVTNLSERELVSLLYQCPNLVECSVDADSYDSDDSDDNTQFEKPLILNHLKRLTVPSVRTTLTPLSAQNIQLPSLEFLQVSHHFDSGLIGDASFCCNLSGTLTTLIVDIAFLHNLGIDDLYRLCKIPFPKLKKLKFKCHHFRAFWEAVHVLARLDGECRNREDCHLPALESITLRCSDDKAGPRSLLDMLKKWRIGDAFYFHLVFRYVEYDPRQWTSKLLDELRSRVDNRKIEVTWGKCKMQELFVQDGLLQKTIQE